MRIVNNDNIPAFFPHRASVSSGHTGESAAMPEEGAAPTVSGKLSALFAGMEMEIAPAELQKLSGAFAAMSSGADGIDSRAALRALLLLRNGVTLSPSLRAVLTAESAGSSFREASGILQQALELFGELNPSGDSSDAVRKLIRALGEITGEELHSAFAGEKSAGNMARAFARSGIGFEWRFLAWYRAGGDPGMLNVLVRDDLKGALLAFLGDLERIRSRGGIDPKALSLEDSVRNLLDRITGRQLDLLLENAEGHKSVHGEIPWGRPEERMYAGVHARGEERGRDDTGEPARFNLSLEIETTGLGPVRVNLRFSGKKMAATFWLRDGKVRSLAENMKDALRGMLRERGYDPGFIRFAVTGETEPYRERPVSNRKRIDRRG